MEIKIGIYKITNPSGASYIGQSTNIYHRWNQYSKLYCEGQQYLYNSLNKHGWENHQKEILEEIYEDNPKKLIELLDEREVYWTKIHKACVDDGGMVLKVGGKHGYRSQETKDKISKSGIGKHDYTKTPEFKQMLKEVHTGKEYSKESRQKMSDIKKGDNHFYRKNPRKESSSRKQAITMLKNNQPILQYNINGEFISEYENYSIACFEIKNQGKKIERGDIRLCCEHKQITCCGYIFQYKNDNKINEVLEKIKNDKFRHNNKIIYQYDLKDHFIKEWKTGYQAEKYLRSTGLKTGASDIKSCCIGKQKIAGGFKWSYNPPLKENIIPEEIQPFLLKYNSDVPYREKIIPKEWFLTHTPEQLEKFVKPLTKWLISIQSNFPFEKIKFGEKFYNEVIINIKKYNLNSLYDNKTFKNSTSSEGVFFLKSRFLSFWKSSYKGGTCPINYWREENIENIIRYRIGINSTRETFDFSLHQIIRGMSAIRGMVSFFKPIVAASIYNYFLKDKVNPTVIDPCAGFGGRLLGFKSIFPEGKYIGIEPNIETYNELNNLVKECNFTNVYLYNCKAEDYHGNKDCDLTFTSIPYYDKETYSVNIVGNDYKNKLDWENKFISGLFTYNNLLVNLPQDLGNLINNIKDTYYLKNTVASHLNKGSKQKIELILKYF